jgi:outer membrane protein OmpA-like peptidoglycan-associated protein
MTRTSERQSTLPRGAAAIIAAISLCVLGACSSTTTTAESTPSSSTAPAEPVVVAGSVVSTAGSSNETDIVIPQEIAAGLSALGASGNGVEWIAVAGDGTTTTEPVGLTGDTAAAVADLTEKMNANQAQAPGREALAGLDAIASPAGSPVWVFSPLLDTQGALDLNQLAFDESPPNVIEAATAAGAVPDLTGREVTFVVTPVAGEQNELSDLQVGYQRAIWEGLATAAGASTVTFFDGTGTTAGTGVIPTVATPDPTDEIASEGSGPTRTCTLPSPALFVPDQAALIDRGATLAALTECVGTLDATTRITVEGHTAAVTGGGDPAFAVDLSTRRATEVAALLREIGVPAENIAEVVGYGDAQPIVEPATDPGNRAVVVTFTSAG